MRLLRRKGWEEAYIDYESLILLLTQIEAVYEESSTNYTMYNGGVGGDHGGSGGEKYLYNADHYFGQQHHQYDDYTSIFYDNGDHDDDHDDDVDEYEKFGDNSSRKKRASQRNRRRRKNFDRTAASSATSKSLLSYPDELFLQSNSSDAYASISDECFEDEFDNVVQHTPDDDSFEQQHMQMQQPRQDSFVSTRTPASIHNSPYNTQPTIHHQQQHFQHARNIFHSNNNNTKHSMHGPNNNEHSVLANFHFSYSAPSYGSAENSNSIHYASSGAGISFGSTEHATNTAAATNHHSHRYFQFQHTNSDVFDEQEEVQQRQEEDQPYMGDVEDDDVDVDVDVDEHYHHHDGNKHDSNYSEESSMIDTEEGRYSNRTKRHSYHRPNRNQQRSSITQTARRGSKQKRRRKRNKQRRSNVPNHIRIAHAKARAVTERFLGLFKAEIDKICLFTHSRMGELTDTCGSLRFPFDTTGSMEFAGTGVSGGGDKKAKMDFLRSASSSSSDSPNSSHDGSRDKEIFMMKPPLFPRNRPKASNNRMNESHHQSTKDEIFSDDDEMYMHTPAWRQLKISEELRLTKPTFQKSDYVLGEDFLLLSAVDEADAYTTVSVEFLHLLKFICVNAIAVRRLCKKHDRLLASRMLGGYYHRLDQNERGSNHKFDTKANQNKLTGVFDSIVLSLANNSVAKDLSESLHLALSEYEVSRRRAESLNPGIKKASYDGNVADVGEEVSCYHFPRPTFVLPSSKTSSYHPFFDEHEKDKSEDDAQSTSSSISLTRLRFAVASVLSLRQAASSHSQPFNDFLCRSLNVVAGSHVVGAPQGLLGCSKEALNNISQYDPDCILLHESHILKTYLLAQNNHFMFSNHLHRSSESEKQLLLHGSEVNSNALSPYLSPSKTTMFYLLRTLNYTSIALTTVSNSCVHNYRILLKTHVQSHTFSLVRTNTDKLLHCHTLRRILLLSIENYTLP